MELGLSLRNELRCSHKLALETRQTQLRLELVAALYDRQYRPNNQCPACSHRMTLLEILQGFNDDPLDRTTECPKCHTRFNCALVTHTAAARIELAFYCPSQTLWFLRTNEGLNLLTPEEFEKTHAAYYHSAIVHFGSLTVAFKREGIHYSFAELPNEQIIQKRLQPFFGKLPDKSIAEATNMPVTKIRVWRREAGIAAYKKRGGKHARA